MSDQPQGEGWWLASDGRWYPPQGSGWWLATDGNWYPPQSEGVVSAVSQRSTRAARMARLTAGWSAAANVLGLSVGLLGGDDDPPAAVGVAAVVLMACGLGLGCLALVLAARGIRSQPDGARAGGFVPGVIVAALVVWMDLMLWRLLSEESIPGIVHVALGLDVLIGVVAGLVWPLGSEQHPAHS